MKLKTLSNSLTLFLIFQSLVSACVTNSESSIIEARSTQLSKDISINKKAAFNNEASPHIFSTSEDELVEKSVSWAASKKYILAIETLISISEKSLKYKKAQELIANYRQSIVKSVMRCKEPQQDALQFSNFYKISAGKYVVQVECYLGAYQPGLEYHLYTETITVTKTKVLNLASFESNKGKIHKTQPELAWGIAHFNQTDKELSLHTRYRAENDCGTLGKYHFENNSFTLKEFKADFICDHKLNYQIIYP